MSLPQENQCLLMCCDKDKSLERQVKTGNALKKTEISPGKPLFPCNHEKEAKD